jgi:hypothetical protein
VRKRVDEVDEDGDRAQRVGVERVRARLLVREARAVGHRRRERVQGVVDADARREAHLAFLEGEPRHEARHERALEDA